MLERHSLLIACAGFALAGAAWSSSARASEVFPPKIRERLGLDADPPCTICHLDDEGGDDTVRKPFGITMMRLGVSGDSDTAKLLAALDAAEQDQVDSDFDNIPDTVELQEGSDPNDGVSLPVPETGCSLAGARDGAWPWAISLVSAAAAWARRRRRAVRPKAGAGSPGRSASPAAAHIFHRTQRGC